MPSPATAPQGDLSLAEQRVLVDVLVGEVRRLQADNAALRAEVQAQQATITALRTENQVRAAETKSLTEAAG
jgi:FtsZ-binding cell division protein ZapB